MDSWQVGKNVQCTLIGTKMWRSWKKEADMTDENPQIMSWIRSTLKDCHIDDFQDPVPDMGLEFITRSARPS